MVKDIVLTESEKMVVEVAYYSTLTRINVFDIHKIIWFCFRAGRAYQKEFGDRKVVTPLDPYGIKNG